MKLSGTAPSETQRQPGISPPSATQALARTAQKISAKARSGLTKTSTKAGKAKRVGKRRQAEGSESKQDRVIALLRRREGATLAALVKTTGWKQHSVRGFLAGTVRKKLKLPLISEKVDGVRTYRIGTGNAAKTAKAVGARSA